MEPRHYNFWPKNLPTSLTYPQTSLCYNLEVSATRYPDKSLLVYYDTPLSFSAAQARKSMRSPAICSSAAGLNAATACCCSCRTARSSCSRSTQSCVPMPWWCRSTR